MRVMWYAPKSVKTNHIAVDAVMNYDDVAALELQIQPKPEMGSITPEPLQECVQGRRSQLSPLARCQMAVCG